MPAYLFVMLLALQAPQSAPPAAPLTTENLGQAYYFFLQGRLLEGRDDLPGAIAAYKQALTLAPKSADLHAELAGLYAQQGQIPQAISEAQAALGLEEDHREAHRILGLIQGALLERSPAGSTPATVNEAIGHLERALAGNFPDAAAQLTLADLYVRNKMPAKAIPVLKKFLDDRPGFPQALLLLAQAYDANGQPDEAAAIRSQLGRGRTPDDQVAAQAQQADTLERAGQWRAAATVWARLLQANPDASAYRARYATALVNSGDIEGGRTALQQVLKDEPDDVSAWYLLSQVESRAGNAAAAEAAAKKISGLDPSDPRAALALAEARSTAHDYRGVITVLEPRLAAATADDIESGAFARMAGELSEAYLELGDRKHAADALESARKRAPEDDDLLYALAGVYERDKRLSDAERMFRDVIASDPKHAGALNYLGYMLADHGQKLDEAVTLIQRALAEEPDNPSYLDSLGWAYVKQSKLDAARDPLERAAAALPKVSVIQDHLGDLYFQLKRYQDAADAFGRALAGDGGGIDRAGVTKKRDRARELAKF